MSTKVCGKCNQQRNIKEFAFKNKALGRRASTCKACHAVYAKQHYKQNKPKYYAARRWNTRAARAYKAAAVEAYKADKGCLFCGEHTGACLDLHHTDPRNKSDKISGMVNDNVSLVRIFREIAKCAVVCANCHRKLHAKLLQLPE